MYEREEESYHGNQSPNVSTLSEVHGIPHLMDREAWVDTSGSLRPTYRRPVFLPGQNFPERK